MKRGEPNESRDEFLEWAYASEYLERLYFLHSKEEETSPLGVYESCDLFSVVSHTHQKYRRRRD